MKIHRTIKWFFFYRNQYFRVQTRPGTFGNEIFCSDPVHARYRVMSPRRPSERRNSMQPLRRTRHSKRASRPRLKLMSIESDCRHTGQLEIQMACCTMLIIRIKQLPMMIRGYKYEKNSSMNIKCSVWMRLVLYFTLRGWKYAAAVFWRYLVFQNEF